MMGNSSQECLWQDWYIFLLYIVVAPEDASSSASFEVSSEAGESSGATSSTGGNEPLHYEAESPDELALVQAANAYGCKLLKRTPDRVIVWLPGRDLLL